MRVNVYHEELPNGCELVTKMQGDQQYIGLRFNTGKGGLNGVTFWGRSRADLITVFGKALEMLAAEVG